MSVIVTFCLYDGIVMAADSRTTLTKSYPDGRQEVSHKDGIKKNFQFGDRDIGILWCGNAQVGMKMYQIIWRDFLIDLAGQQQ